MSPSLPSFILGSEASSSFMKEAKELCQQLEEARANPGRNNNRYNKTLDKCYEFIRKIHPRYNSNQPNKEATRAYILVWETIDTPEPRRLSLTL